MVDVEQISDWNAVRRELQDATEHPAKYLERLERLGQHDPQMANYWCSLGVGAAWELSQPDVAGRWLRRSLDLGWFQSELSPNFQDVLNAQPDARALEGQRRANIPPPPAELLQWPDAPPSFELPRPKLSPEREARLRDQLPPAEASASATALSLLTWASTRWKHSGNEDAHTADALELLERSAAGERFRCVEYSVLLTAALQAHGIPALVLGLTLEIYHAGIGVGHVVTAAWLDDLGEWVVLDGQNGAIWHDGAPAVSDGRVPLGVLELQRRCRAGESRPHFSQPDGTPVDGAEGWWLYFFHLRPNQGAAVGESFIPYFQGQPYLAPRLTRHAEALWPDLSALSTSVAAQEGRVALRFTPVHPYAVGVSVDGEALPGDLYPLPSEPGDYRQRVQTVGPFGALSAQPLRLTVHS